MEVLLCCLRSLGWLILSSGESEGERLRLWAERFLLLSLLGDGEVKGEEERRLSWSPDSAAGESGGWRADLASDVLPGDLGAWRLEGGG